MFVYNGILSEWPKRDSNLIVDKSIAQMKSNVFDFTARRYRCSTTLTCFNRSFDSLYLRYVFDKREIIIRRDYVIITY